jgi:tRNA(fMet)-specific endonuclease VapC
VGRRLILDTCVLISVERGRHKLVDIVRPDDTAVIAAITAAELLEGVLRAGEKHAVERTRFVTQLLQLLPVVDYTLETARTHAMLLATTAKIGRQRGAHDLIIAATALTVDCTLVTSDGKAAFNELPGLRVISLRE